MVSPNSIIARKLALERSKASREWPRDELHNVESDIMALKISHEIQFLEDLQNTHVDLLGIKRRAVKKKCFCPTHLSQDIMARKIAVSG